MSINAYNPLQFGGTEISHLRVRAAAAGRPAWRAGWLSGRPKNCISDPQNRPKIAEKTVQGNLGPNWFFKGRAEFRNVRTAFGKALSMVAALQNGGKWEIHHLKQYG